MSHDLLVQIAYQSVKSENQQQTALTFLQPKFQPSSHRSEKKRKGRKKR